MTQELIHEIAEKTGLSEDQAKSAAQAVLNFLKSRVPPAIGSQIDKIASGGTSTAGSDAATLGNAAEKVGGMFGRNK